MLLNAGTTTTETPATPATLAEVTLQTFASDVIQASREHPVLVDFWAPWCGPCKQLGPVLEKVAKTASGRARIVKMNIDEHPQIAQQMGIQSIPAVVAFHNGQPVDAFMGAQPEEKVIAFIERLTGPLGPGDAETLVEAADEALEAGDLATASALYSEALSSDKDSLPARVGLARTYLRADDSERAKQLLAEVPATKESDPSVAAVRAEIALAEQAASLGDIAELAARIERDSDDHQARLDLALALNARGERREALDHLLEIVRRDRAWNDDAARRQIVQLFEAWGPTDALTHEGRRRLSSLLFA